MHSSFLDLDHDGEFSVEEKYLEMMPRGDTLCPEELEENNLSLVLDDDDDDYEEEF